MTDKEKKIVRDLYARIQRIAGLLQTYKIARSLDGDTESDIKGLQAESDGIAENVAELRNYSQMQ